MEQAMARYPKEAQRMTAAQLTAVFISSLLYGFWSLNVFDDGFEGIPSSLAIVGSEYPWLQWMLDPMILFSLFWTGCITTALTIYMETLALEHLSAAETTLIFSTEPLWGTAFAVAVMNEKIGMNAAVGGFFILVACIYSNSRLNGMSTTLQRGLGQWNTSLKSITSTEGTNETEANTIEGNTRFTSWLASGITGTFATLNLVTKLSTEEIREILDDRFEHYFMKNS
jgi:hypothetical protein